MSNYLPSPAIAPSAAVLEAFRVAAKAAKPTADFPIFLEYQDDAYEAVERLSITEITSLSLGEVTRLCA